MDRFNMDVGTILKAVMNKLVDSSIAMGIRRGSL